jgi:hypothetical protein
MTHPPLLIESRLPIAAVGAESQRERGASSALPPLYFLPVRWERRLRFSGPAAALTGVHRSLLFLAIGPLRKVDCVEAIGSGHPCHDQRRSVLLVLEVHPWPAAERAQKALRMLLADG